MAPATVEARARRTESIGIVHDLAIDVERDRGVLLAHIERCDERADNLHNLVVAMQTSINGLVVSVQSLIKEGAEAKGAAIAATKSRFWAMGSGTLTAIIFMAGVCLTIMGWMGGELYSQEPARVADALRQAQTGGPPAASAPHVTP